MGSCLWGTRLDIMGGRLGEFLLDAGEEWIVRGGPGDMGEHGRDVLQD